MVRGEGLEEVGLLGMREGEPAIGSVHVHGLKLQGYYRNTEVVVGLKSRARHGEDGHTYRGEEKMMTVREGGEKR